MTRLTLSILIVFGLSTLPAFGQSDVDTEQLMEILRDAARNTWILVLQPRFADAATDTSTANQIRTTHLRILRNFDVNAWSGNGEILLPVGLLFQVNAMADAELLVEQKAGTWEDLSRYADYLADKHHLATLDHPQLIETFSQFEHIPKSKVDQIVAVPGYSQRKQKLMVDSMSWLFGHELGHIVLHHPPYNQIPHEQAQLNEFAADKFGYKLAEDAGFTPSASFATIFPIFVAMDHGATISSPESTHPTSNCRIFALVPKNLDKLMSDPGSANALSQIGMTPAQVAKSDVALRAACKK